MTIKEQEKSIFSFEITRGPKEKDLQDIQNLLIENKIDYRVIGSVAVNSYIHESDIISDLDILIPRADLDKAKAMFDGKGRILHKGDVTIDFGPARYIDFRPVEKFSYLTHEALSVPVRSTLFESTAGYTHDGTYINTIPSLTLFHTFVVVGGILRSTDWKKILSLGRYIRQTTNYNPPYQESDFEEFHHFLKLREEFYPNYLTMRKLTQILLSPLSGKMKHNVVELIEKFLQSS